MSIVDPTAPKPAPAPRQGAPAAPRPVSRPAGGAGGASSAPQLKRKASGAVESSQIKLPRRDGTGQPAQTNGAVRPVATPSAARSNPPAPISTVPYRGTAAPAGARVASPVVRKPTPQATASSVAPKAAAPSPRPTPPAAAASSASSAGPKKGYLALLQKAKEKDATKPAAPPLQNAPTKILTKKERLALKSGASANAKGKKPVVGQPVRLANARSALPQDKKKSVEVGYQGTARPTKQPVQVGYKGTARPSSAPASTSRNGTPAARSKPKPAQGRLDGYADWSDLDAEEDEEDDYASDASSDMEGGMWDVEKEEQMALRAAKQEDAEALAEENRLKEEKRRKLMALANKAAAKKKY